ncbi:uncharacterized protein LOC131932164 [Physella acuta]|uniref:uncharacterized protein LOC131932164 n=1 Tax=Physella acuta TaxID=109671 RepID=UPI0027DC6A87|nr:uncharacterized protein LOC131932164 [Physella acuta]
MECENKLPKLGSLVKQQTLEVCTDFLSDAISDVTKLYQTESNFAILETREQVYEFLRISPLYGDVVGTKLTEPNPVDACLKSLRVKNAITFGFKITLLLEMRSLPDEYKAKIMSRYAEELTRIDKSTSLADTDKSTSLADTDKSTSLADADKSTSLVDTGVSTSADTDKSTSADTDKSTSADTDKSTSADTDKSTSTDTDKSTSLEDTDKSTSLEDIDSVTRLLGDSGVTHWIKATEIGNELICIVTLKCKGKVKKKWLTEKLARRLGSTGQLDRQLENFQSLSQVIENLCKDIKMATFSYQPLDTRPQTLEQMLKLMKGWTYDCAAVVRTCKQQATAGGHGRPKERGRLTLGSALACFGGRSREVPDVDSHVMPFSSRQVESRDSIVQRPLHVSNTFGSQNFDYIPEWDNYLDFTKLDKNVYVLRFVVQDIQCDADVLPGSEALWDTSFVSATTWLPDTPTTELDTPTGKPDTPIAETDTPTAEPSCRGLRTEMIDRFRQTLEEELKTCSCEGVGLKLQRLHQEVRAISPVSPQFYTLVARLQHSYELLTSRRINIVT